MSDKDNALRHIEDAITALSIHMERSSAGGSNGWSTVDPIEASLAVPLERVDSALGPRGESMFFPIAEQIKLAMIELHAARDCLSRWIDKA